MTNKLAKIKIFEGFLSFIGFSFNKYLCFLNKNRIYVNMPRLFVWKRCMFDQQK
uniref:Uncharacterized protein n=1 Tax=Meloidogyne enterolobii TaxID=390850 RepID=A0A6V7XH53_MELEN|nr:unnamed protein product [Meloidogyne enterolobii]